MNQHELMVFLGFENSKINFESGRPLTFCHESYGIKVIAFYGNDSKYIKLGLTKLFLNQNTTK